MTASDLFDIRSTLWKEAFADALPYSDYVKTGTSTQQERWQAYRESVSLTNDQRDRAREFKRRLNVLVLSGVWCGDCARQCPMLDLIGSASSGIEIRFLDNQANPRVRDELRIHGASRVPVVVFLSEDFFEVGRFGDRQLAAYRRKARTELGAACDAGILPASADELVEEVAQWFECFEREQLLLRLSPFLRLRHND
jgi:hypothetical protein